MAGRPHKSKDFDPLNVHISSIRKDRENERILYLQSKCILSIIMEEHSRHERSGIMANKENTTIRVEPELKKQAAALFKALGMDLSTATGIFYRQALRYQGLPFEVRMDEPNAETLAAFEEGERMLHDPSAPRYSSVDELFAELDAG